MGDIASVLSVVFGGVATVMGAATLYVKAKSIDSAQINVLRRLWDWIESVSEPDADRPLSEQVPPRLKADADRVLDRDNGKESAA